MKSSIQEKNAHPDNQIASIEERPVYYTRRKGVSFKVSKRGNASLVAQT
jgi:hypothetical protein